MREPRSILEAAEQAAAAGNYTSAEELLREAALVQEASLGPLHRDLAETLNNLGIVCEINNKPDDAEHYFRRACSIAAAVLDRDHPFVATSQKNFRDFCEARGKPVELSTPAPEVAATPEAQATSAVDSPRKSQVHAERQDLQLEDRRVFARLAIGALGPISMLMVILAVGLPRLNPTAWTESSSAIASDSAREIHPPPHTPAAVEPTPKTANALRTPKTTGAIESGTNGANARGITAASTPARPTVVKAQLCASLDEWRCDPPQQPARPGLLFFYTQVKSTSATTVQHRWYQGNRLHRSVELRVQADQSVGYRTYSRNTVNRETAGDWKVELRTDDGVLLHEERFSIR